MLASDVWIEELAILSHEDAYNSVDPLSSEDVAVVVDFHWFTDCHLEAICSAQNSGPSDQQHGKSIGHRSLAGVFTPSRLHLLEKTS